MAVAVLCMSSCSVLLNFTECETETDCAIGAQCVEGICEAPQRVSVTDQIVKDTTWTADNIYVLENITFVVAPATLTIEPGTKILGRRNTGLVALAGARLEAVGTRQNPIVFTSDKQPGQRLAGDWAGIGMVGRAPTNRENFNLRIITDQYDTSVGGTDDSWNCGTLKYVRVEFGGSEVDGQNALDGVVLAGCGSETTVEHVQTHLSDDDGFGVFGGSVDLRYVVSTRPRDDAFDFDTGWTGTAQFVAAQLDLLGGEAIEMENLGEDATAEPQTNAQVYNATVIGADREGDRQVGLYFKHGGLGTVSHSIVTGVKTAALEIEGAEAAAHAEAGDIQIQNTLFYNSGERGEGWFRTSEPMEPVGGGTAVAFDNYSIYEAEETGNLFGQDPGFDDPYNLENPGWVPSATNVTGVDPPPDGFDPTAVYRGAFSPSAPPWTEGWTAYPLN